MRAQTSLRIAPQGKNPKNEFKFRDQLACPCSPKTIIRQVCEMKHNLNGEVYQ